MKKHLNTFHRDGPYSCVICRNYSNKISLPNFIRHCLKHFEDENILGLNINDNYTEEYIEPPPQSLTHDDHFLEELSDSTEIQEPNNLSTLEEELVSDLSHDLNHIYSVRNTPASTMNIMIDTMRKHLKRSNQLLLNNIIPKIEDNDVKRLCREEIENSMFSKNLDKISSVRKLKAAIAEGKISLCKNHLR